MDKNTVSVFKPTEYATLDIQTELFQYIDPGSGFPD